MTTNPKESHNEQARKGKDYKGKELIPTAYYLSTFH